MRPPIGTTVPLGCSIGPSFTWGFVAAKHAANLDNAGLGNRAL